MKCDELKNYDVQGARLPAMPGKGEFVKRADVDAAIEELKAEINRKEAVGKRWFEQCMEARAENVRLKRALWLARANRANAEWGHWATIWFCDTSIILNINKSSVSQEPYRCTIKRNAAMWRNVWNEVERKCRAKAEEYK